MARVLEHYTQLNEFGTPLPEIVELLAGPVKDVLLTMESLDDLIALLMVESIEHNSYYISVERSVRDFLTHFADMDAKLQRKTDTTSWLLSYNFLSLLNLPNIIREYGPLRLIWEGGSKGEGFLRFVKPNINQGLRKGWELSTLSNLLKEKALATLVCCDELGSCGRLEGRLYEKNYHVYKDIAGVPLMLQRAQKPISAVAYSDGTIGVVANFFEEPRFMPLVALDPGISKCGKVYLQWYLDESEGTDSYELLDVERITSYVLLLNLLQGSKDYDHPEYESNVYTAILSNHTSVTLAII